MDFSWLKRSMPRGLYGRVALILLLPGLCGQQGTGVLSEPPGLKVIQGGELAEWAGHLASDEFGGRMTGSPGQAKAAEYVTAHFESLGLEPLGDADPSGVRGFLQHYPLVRTYLDPEATRLVLTGETDDREFTTGFAVVPGSAQGAVDSEGEFVYAGLVGSRSFKRGIQLDDWTGKIPVLVVDIPDAGVQLGIEQQMMTGTFLLASMKRRVDRFVNQGAEVVVLCVLDSDTSAGNMLSYASLLPGQDMLESPGSVGAGMGVLMQMMQSKSHTVYTGREVSLALLGAFGIDADAAAAAQDEEALSRLKGASGSVQIKVSVDRDARASNVVAVLRGSDPDLRHEAVVFSAHQDHVGLRVDGDVFNGADDNASGSAGLMSIAKAFATADLAPRRSIIFLSVSGEELGLWGSAYFAANPAWPIREIVANINTDMIGRSGPESGPEEVAVTPSYRHEKFSTIVREAAEIAEVVGLGLRNGDKYYTRSDHYNFAQKGVPVVFFCDGEHEDYHQVSDHADKLDPQKMESIARLAYWTGYRIAEADGRPFTLGRSTGWRR